MTKVRGWHKSGKAKWHDGRITKEFLSKTENVIGFQVARVGDDWADMDDVIDIRMDVGRAREFVKSLDSLINSHDKIS